MSDNLANEWGHILCFPDKSESVSFSLFEMRIRQATDGKFVLSKVVTCGSDANLWAIAQATDGDTGSCLLACGSYVAGDGGLLESWSTSGFSVREPTAKITNPASATSFTQNHTVALPYHIPCNNCSQDEGADVADFEDKCMNEIHIRCLLAKIAGQPYKALLLSWCLLGMVLFYLTGH